jgi:hypothetical protein
MGMLNVPFLERDHSLKFLYGYDKNLLRRWQDPAWELALLEAKALLYSYCSFAGPYGG